MKIFRMHVPFTKRHVEKGPTTTVSNWGSGMSAGTNFQTSNQSFKTDDVTRSGAVYTAINVISSDIAKMPVTVYKKLKNGGFEPVPTNPLSRLMLKPNPYQTRVDLISQIMYSALMRGNAYIYVTYDSRNQPNGLYVLNPDNVTPLVDDKTGAVFYSVGTEPLIPGLGATELTSSLNSRWNIPARLIIHHRLGSLNPLVGISPLHSALNSVLTSLNIQGNQREFFGNMARPSGVLRTDNVLDEAVIARLRAQWENLFSGANASKFGGTAVLEQGVAFDQLTMTSVDAQMLETLKWTITDVASAFRLPTYFLGDMTGSTFNNAEHLFGMYLSTCLSYHLENLENRFDTFFGLQEQGMYMEFDVRQFLRTNFKDRMEGLKVGIQGGVMTPNEARRTEGLSEVEGGDEVYMQQQMIPLDKLGEEIVVPPVVEPEPEPEPTIEELAAEIRQKSNYLRVVK